MIRINNLYRLVSFSYRAWQGNRSNGKMHQKVLTVMHKITEEAKALNDGSIPEKIYRKLQWYQVTTLFYGKMAAALSGTKLTPQQEQANMIIGDLIGLSDIIIDDFQLSSDRVIQLLDNESRGDESAIETTVRLYLKHLKLLMPAENRARFLKTYHRLLNAQIDSRRQFDQGISLEEVDAICADKGGASLRLCNTVLDEENPDLDKASDMAGAFVQYLNDAQDVVKDMSEGIQTFMSYQQSFDEVVSFLEEKRQSFFSTLKSLDLNRKVLHSFLFEMGVMYCMIFYKLAQLEQKVDGDYQKLRSLSTEEGRVEVHNLSALKYALRMMGGFSFEGCDMWLLGGTQGGARFG